jgi:hypothetical protein
MYGVGQEVKGDAPPAGIVEPKVGFTQREIEGVWAAGGKLTLAQALRCRVRHFTNGVVLGNQSFVDDFFSSQREAFGVKRKSGGRRMKGAQGQAARTEGGRGGGAGRLKALRHGRRSCGPRLTSR